MLDYAVVSTRGAHLLDVQVFARLEVPWATHCALEVSLTESATAWEYERLELPAKLPTPARPKRAPDPLSKRSRQRARKLLHDAPAELQEALADTLDVDPASLTAQDEYEEFFGILRGFSQVVIGITRSGDLLGRYSAEALQTTCVDCANA